MRFKTQLCLGFLGFSCIACETSKSYEDPSAVEIIGDKFTVSDLNLSVSQLIKDLTNHPNFKRWVLEHKKTPFVLLDRLANKTSEIDLPVQMIEDNIKDELIQSGVLRFVDGAARRKLLEEYRYQNSGLVRQDQRKKAGSQVGADIYLSGSVGSVVSQESSIKSVYYQITLRATDIETSEIIAVATAKLKKHFKKKTFSF